MLYIFILFSAYALQNKHSDEIAFYCKFYFILEKLF